MCAVSQAEAVSSPCRPLTNRPPVPDGTTLHYAVASTEAKLVFSDREVLGGLDILESASKTRRHSNCPYENINKLVFGFRTGQIGWKQIRNTKYEHPPRRIEPRLFELAFRSSLTLNSWSREKDFFDGEIRHNPATRDSSQGTSARPEPPSHPASAYRLSGGPRREAARPRRDTHGDEVPVAFHLRHSCVRRPRKLW